MSVLPKIKHAADELPDEPSERLIRPFQRFASLSSSGGLVLLGATIIALVWANGAYSDQYHHLFHEIFFTIGLGAEDDVLGIQGKSYNLHWWINDLLMAVFFLLVGLEIKREIVVGELSDLKRAALPVIAAFGGMIGPALIYVAFNLNQPTIRGWGVPMATDIAFALGILALIGARAPTSLKVFLASLAIADDLGALAVIAAFYTESLDIGALSVCGAIMALLIALNLLGFRRALWYVLPGLVLWYFVYESGVHATIAGVLLAGVIPVSSRVNADRYLKHSRALLDKFEQHSSPDSDIETNAAQRTVVLAVDTNNKFVMPLLHRMEHGLHPWVAFMIIPVFALANAGVHIGEEFASGGLIGFFKTVSADPVMQGIVLGLFIGKPLGIFLLSWLSVKLGIASLPRGVSWRHIVGVGFLAGIGFTMAIFISNLAFEAPSDATPEALAIASEHRDHATIAILLASALATVIGLGLLLTCSSVDEPDSFEDDEDHDSYSDEPAS